MKEASRPGGGLLCGGRPGPGQEALRNYGDKHSALSAHAGGPDRSTFMAPLLGEKMARAGAGSTPARLTQPAISGLRTPVCGSATAHHPHPPGVAVSHVCHTAGWEYRTQHIPSTRHLALAIWGPPKPRLPRCSWLGAPNLDLPLPPSPCNSMSPEPSCCPSFFSSGT